MIWFEVFLCKGKRYICSPRAGTNFIKKCSMISFSCSFFHGKVFISLYMLVLVNILNLKKDCDTGCSLDIVFFPGVFESLPPLPRQHSPAIGCTKNYQPIGVTVHPHCVENFEGLLQRCRRGRDCIEL